jgi:DNA-binding NarL/FixJ family response regulator
MARQHIKLLLVDDHAILRTGLRYVLSEIEDLEIVAEAGSVQETMHALSTTTPDLVLLDISLPDGSGLEVLKVIKQDYPHTRTIMLTTHADTEFVVHAFAHGAEGYVLKAQAADQLLATIRRVLDGQPRVPAGPRCS